MYVVFSVSGRAEKEKTAVIVAQKDEACVSWKDSIIEIEIPDPTKAEVLVRYRPMLLALSPGTCIRYLSKASICSSQMPTRSIQSPGRSSDAEWYKLRYKLAPAGMPRLRVHCHRR